VWKISLSLCQARIARTWSELAFDADCGRQDRGPEDPSGAAVEQSKQQVAEYKRFRELSRELIEISDRICDLRLKDLDGAREVETKKKTPWPQICKVRSHGRSKNCSVPKPWRRSTSRLWKGRCGAGACSWPPAYSSSDSTATMAITKAARCPVPVAAGALCRTTMAGNLREEACRTGIGIRIWNQPFDSTRAVHDAFGLRATTRHWSRY